MHDIFVTIVISFRTIYSLQFKLSTCHVPHLLTLLTNTLTLATYKYLFYPTAVVIYTQL